MLKNAFHFTSERRVLYTYNIAYKYITLTLVLKCLADIYLDWFRHIHNKSLGANNE